MANAAKQLFLTWISHLENYQLICQKQKNNSKSSLNKPNQYYKEKEFEISHPSPTTELHKQQLYNLHTGVNILAIKIILKYLNERLTQF